jgi:hypothetical protein
MGKYWTKPKFINVYYYDQECKLYGVSGTESEDKGFWTWISFAPESRLITDSILV